MVHLQWLDASNVFEKFKHYMARLNLARIKSSVNVSYMMMTHTY